MKQIKDYQESTDIANDDLLLIQPNAGGIYKKITKANLIKGLATGSSSSSGGLLLDNISQNILSARSFRKLYSSYQGACLTARNEVNIVADIPFVDNALSNNSLSQFAGSGRVFVRQLNDQIASQHISQTTNNLQPLIYGNGIQVTSGGKAGMICNGQYLQAPVYGALPMHIIVVGSIQSLSTRGAFLKVGDLYSGFGIGVGGGNWLTNGRQLVGLREEIAWMAPSINLDLYKTYIFEMYADSNSTTIYLNGNTVASSGNVISPRNTISLGGYVDRTPACLLHEDIIISGIVPLFTRLKILQNIADYYGIV